MIETIKNFWLDLKGMNLGAEKDTMSMLSTLEKRSICVSGLLKTIIIAQI